MIFEIGYREGIFFVFHRENCIHQAAYEYAGQTSYFQYEEQDYVLVVNNYAVVCKMENVSNFLKVPDKDLLCPINSH